MCSEGLIRLRHSPLPAGFRGTGRTPRGVARQECAPVGVAFWGVAPWNVALLLDVCQLKDLLRLWWSLCGDGGAHWEGGGVAPPGEGPGSTP